MKLATLDDIVHLKVDHKVGSLVNVNTGKKVTLRPFRIVYARYSKKNFRQQTGGGWKLTCSSPDALVGVDTGGKETRCLSSVICQGCKPVLTVGILTTEGSMAVLEASASVARTFSDAISPLAAEPVPIFDRLLSLKIALTQKSEDMTYAQVVLRPAPGPSVDVEACLDARERLRRVIDQKVDRKPGAPARPNLGGASLKM